MKIWKNAYNIFSLDRNQTGYHNIILAKSVPDRIRLNFERIFLCEKYAGTRDLSKKEQNS